MSKHLFILNRKVYETCEVEVEADHYDEAESLALIEAEDNNDLWKVDFSDNIQIDSYTKID